MMSVEEAEKAVLDTINEACRMLLSEMEATVARRAGKETDPAVKIRKLKAEQERIEHSVTALYEAYKAGELSRDDFKARSGRTGG